VGDEGELVAFAGHSEFSSSRRWIYSRSIRLFSNLDTVQPPPIFNADTFPAHLALGTPINFDYSTSLSDSTTPTSPQDPGFPAYQGHATLREVQAPAPVPEPATLALMGGGLAVLFRRQTQRKRVIGQRHVI